MHFSYAALVPTLSYVERFLFQALNKVLSLSNIAAAASHSEHMTWNNLLISTSGVCKFDSVPFSFNHFEPS